MFPRNTFPPIDNSHATAAISAGTSALLLLGAVWFLYRPRTTQGHGTKTPLAPTTVEDLKESWANMNANTDDVVVTKILVHPIKVRVSVR